MGYYHCSSSHGDEYGVLQQCLEDILCFIKPTLADEAMRDRAFHELKIVVRWMESLKDVEVRVRTYGSFISDLYTKWGDLDLSVELKHHSFLSSERRRQIKVLQDIISMLRRMGFARNLKFIPRARVPVLRYESKRQNVSCDVSIDNHLGWMKSRVLFLISGIDKRFRDLIKEWAMTHNINDPKSGTLNSYSLCLLVIFHFQTCEPTILPPLKDIYGRNFVDLKGPMPSIEREIEDEKANIAKFKSSRQRNGDNLAQLFIKFFDKIEDPFHRPDNAARSVGPQELHTISEAFEKTIGELSESSVLSSRNDLLANLVRPNVRTQIKETVGFIGVSTHRYI